VLARPESPNGELRNIEWESGGMFGQDWMLFLFSIRLIYSPARPEASSSHANSTDTTAAKLSLCVAWILIGTTAVQSREQIEKRRDQ